MNKKLLALFAMMLAAASAVAKDEDPDSTSLSLDEEVFGSSESSSNSEDMDAAAAEAMLDVGDLEYEDEDTSSDDEEGRRYLRANGKEKEDDRSTRLLQPRCRRVGTRGRCSTTPGCRWNQRRQKCVRGRKVDEEATQVKKDEAECSKYNFNQCELIEGCYHYCDLNGCGCHSYERPDPVSGDPCSNLFNIGPCQSKAGCVWHCHDLGCECSRYDTGVSCFHIREQSYCNLRNDCVWSSKYNYCTRKNVNRDQCVRDCQRSVCPDLCEVV